MGSHRLDFFFLSRFLVFFGLNVHMCQLNAIFQRLLVLLACVLAIDVTVMVSVKPPIGVDKSLSPSLALLFLFLQSWPTFLYPIPR